MLNLVMKLSKKLKKIRLILDISQDQMAQKLGLTSESRRARISEWEAGRREPKRDILIKYAEISNISIKRLIDDREKLIDA